MKRDFTLKTYSSLIRALKDSGYRCTSYLDFLDDGGAEDKVAILRHDVDKKPENSLAKAIIESELNVRATYYFRTVKCSFDPHIIRQIADLGHEIGYHYEDLSLCRGNSEVALKMFERNLANLRDLYPVQTICMHGSPLSKWDNKLLWREFDYRDYDIVGEPYFDLDFDEVFYLTDTGMKWNAGRFSIRDKVSSKIEYECDTTYDIIAGLESSCLPEKIMINTHPQRWNNNVISWTSEWATQLPKNVAKLLINSLGV